MKKISMQNIADNLGISKVTVYRALKDKYGVSDDLKFRIHNYAHSIGYFDRGKSEKKPRNFAFVIAQEYFFEGEEFYHSIYQHLEQICFENHQKIKPYKISAEDNLAGKFPEDIRSGKIDGIFLTVGLSSVFMSALCSLHLPSVAIDFDDMVLQMDSVLVDNYAMGIAATEMLIKNGHHSIGFVGNPRSHKNILNRFFGYRCALYSHHIEFLPEWQTSNNDIHTSLYRTNFPLPDPLPTSFVCDCDCAAYYLIERLKMEHKRIPEDVSVIAFDDNALAVKMTPQLTTISVNCSDFASIAHSILLQRVANPNMKLQKIYLQGEILQRESSRRVQDDFLPVSQD